MLATGTCPTVTVNGADVAEHPFALVMFTVYEPAAPVVIDCVVCPPGDHKYDDIADGEFKITEDPWQNVVDPIGVIMALGAVLTVTVTGVATAEHPVPVATDT